MWINHYVCSSLKRSLEEMCQFIFLMLFSRHWTHDWMDITTTIRRDRVKPWNIKNKVDSVWSESIWIRSVRTQTPLWRQTNGSFVLYRLQHISSARCGDVYLHRRSKYIPSANTAPKKLRTCSKYKSLSQDTFVYDIFIFLKRRATA